MQWVRAVLDPGAHVTVEVVDIGEIASSISRSKRSIREIFEAMPLGRATSSPALSTPPGDLTGVAAVIVALVGLGEITFCTGSRTLTRSVGGDVDVFELLHRVEQDYRSLFPTG